MMNISYENQFSAASQPGNWAAGRRETISLHDTFITKVTGNAVYIEQVPVETGITWEDVEKIPSKYALKDGKSISVYHSAGNYVYKFFHAAESTEEYPVLVAKGIDGHGMYFEEKINVKQINPYNTSTLELQALEHFMPGEYKSISNPYDCMQGQEKGLRERINYVAGAQRLIKAWKRIGYAGQAAQWNEELNFLLSYTENTAEPGGIENQYRVDAAFFENISGEYKRNLELYCNAARERLAASMAKRCSEDLLDII